MKNVITVILFFLLLFLCHFLAHTQNNHTNFSAGFGTYKMGSLKRFQDNLINHGIPFSGVRAVDMFPNYFNWLIAQERYFNPNHSAALEFSYLYTGGRNSLADYSGRYTLDMLANSYRLGLSYTYYVKKKIGNQKLSEFISFRSGWARTTFHIKEEIEIFHLDQQNMELDFFSDSFYLEFSPGLTYEVTPYLSIHLSMGYQYEKDAILRSTENKESTLSISNQRNLTTNWSGLRLRTGIGINLGSLSGNKKQ